MKTRNLIKNPTIKSLTKFSLECAANIISGRKTIPTAFYCIGDQNIKLLGCSNLPDDNALKLFSRMCGHLCVAEAGKAVILINDVSVVAPKQKPGEFAVVIIETPGLHIRFIYSIARDKEGNQQLGEKLEGPIKAPVSQSDQLLPIGVPTLKQRLDAAFDFSNMVSILQGLPRIEWKESIAEIIAHSMNQATPE